MFEKMIDQRAADVKDAELDDNGEVIRDYVAKYAMIFVNEHYDKLTELLESNDLKEMADIPFVKDDLVNIRPILDMMGIKKENTYELVDSNRDSVSAAEKDILKKILRHKKNNEKVMIFAYAAGHGIATAQ